MEERNALRPALEPQADRVSPVDLAQWREFQEGLSKLLGMPISLFDTKGAVLSAPDNESSLCGHIRENPAARERCRQTYEHAVSHSIEKSGPYIHKCHSNQYVFAVPVFLDEQRCYVVVGGQVYLRGNEISEFEDGMCGRGFDAQTLNALRSSIDTIPPKDIFTIPEAVNSLAGPFLKSLCANNDARQDKGRLMGFCALEQAYRSIAPILDREELYATILAKSSELVDAESASLMILDSKNNVLSVQASKGIDKAITDSLKIKIGEGISGKIAAKGIPVMVRDIEAEVPSWKSRPRYKTKSFMSVPLKLGSRVIGVINVADKAYGGYFSEEDLRLLLSLANYASIALERGAYYFMSEELKMLSMTDPLTGLFNRRYFRERLFEEAERVKRHNECFTAFMIDIDDFKSFNDKYGHSAGDMILKKVARATRDAVRSMDVVARYGGEEFAVILPHTNKKDAYIIADRIRKNVEEFKPAINGILEAPTISLGVAEMPFDASNIDDLMHKADSAMYTAKKLGKNRVVIYEG